MNPVLGNATPAKVPKDSRAGDEIDLLAYAASCWKYRYVLLAVALVVGAVTYVINRQLAPTYETRFRLMGTEPGLDQSPRTTLLNVVAFRELVESPTEVAGLLGEFGLDRPPYNLSPQAFLSNNVNVELIRDSTIIEVTVRLKEDRDLLVKLARRYAERVVETAQRLNTDGIDYTTARIKEQRDLALENLTHAEKELNEFRRKAQIELLRQDVETLLGRRPEALDLNVRIEGARARLRQAEAELTSIDRTRNVRRSVDVLPHVAAPAAPASPSTATKPQAGEQPPAAEKPRTSGAPAATEELRIRPELLDPYVNPVYDALQRDVSALRAEVAGLEQERRALVSRLNLDAREADRLNKLYEAESQLETLTRHRDIARQAYLNAANKYEEARLQSTLRSPRLQILDQALPPDAAVAPRALRNTLAAILIALAASGMAAIMVDHRRNA